MNSKSLSWAVRVLSVLVLLSTAAALAQERRGANFNGVISFTGLINDYSPANVKGGPWEMHGQWSLDLQRWWGVADFSADMTMSDYGTTAGVLDATKGGQSAHTHHIKVTNAAVIWNMDGCPTFSPATTMGFQFSGTVSLITGNGGPAPFETDSAVVDTAGLHHRRGRRLVLEHYPGVRWACDYAFRTASNPRRRA